MQSVRPKRMMGLIVWRHPHLKSINEIEIINVRWNWNPVFGIDVKLEQLRH